MHNFNFSGVLKSSNIIKAFKKIDRKDFVIPEYVDHAYEDIPLPIGYSQTISQPTTVAFMLELLDLKAELKVLDVGSGSGWTTALLAYIVGNKGKVTGIEIIPELVAFGQKNIDKYCKGLNIDILPAVETIGYPLGSPYDRILVSASADKIPLELIKQLKIGGVMVIPVRNSVYKIVRRSNDINDVLKEEYPGFAFVPLRI